MTKQEAINIINFSDLFWTRNTLDEANALNMAIEALKAQDKPIICPRCGRVFAVSEGREAAEALKAQEWIPVNEKPKHHKDVLGTGIEAFNNERVYKVMQWDGDKWRPENYSPSITWDAWKEIDPYKAEALKAQDWIPVKWHEITDEERELEGYPKDWVVHIDCEMPCDEQEILVQTKTGCIRWDVCYEDGEFSLDSGWDWIEDIVAWMPLPEPYKGEREDKE